MRRTIVPLMAAAALVAALAVPAAAATAEGEPVSIMVMKHECVGEMGAGIGTVADFAAVENAGAGGEAGGEGTIPGLVATVLACPTIVNPGDEGTQQGIAGEPVAFQFEITDSAGTTVTQDQATLMAAQVCETDVKLDADGNGEISADTCLDTTHYVFEGLVSGNITVRETQPPQGTVFGTLRTTPTAVDGNNDAESVVSVGDVGSGIIELNTTPDEDGTVMLHVYNFQAATDMPDAAMIPAAGGSPLLALGLLFVAAGSALALRRVGVRSE